LPFCPECRDEFEDWVEECPDCHVRLVATLPEPPLKPPDPEYHYIPEPLVTVATYSYPLEAHLHRAKLESEGIDSVVVDEHIVNANWLYSIAVGGVRLQVKESDLARAREILDKIPEHVPEELEISTEVGDDERCPQCHSIDIHYERFHIRRTFFFWFLAYLVLPFTLPFFKRKWKCHNCGYEWKERRNNKTPES
jgi:ssDNA-binding Zn-finger/Zn-ribbon topoisomerase 1